MISDAVSKVDLYHVRCKQMIVLKAAVDDVTEGGNMSLAAVSNDIEHVFPNTLGR